METARYRCAYLHDNKTVRIETTWCELNMDITEALKMAGDIVSIAEECLEQKGRNHGTED